MSTATSRNASRPPHNFEATSKLVKPIPDLCAKSTQQQAPSKKPTRKSSKPFINWFQRKLAGTVRSKRVSSGTPLQPVNGDGSLLGKGCGVPSSNSRHVAPSALPVPGAPPRHDSHAVRTSIKADTANRTTVSLNGDELKEAPGGMHDDNEGSACGSSVGLESSWSPTSVLEADGDASIQPIPPSSPPSPSPSRSSSSYLSDPRTFRSNAASTKPTTLLSVDITPNGVAHIAQVPPTPISQVAWFPPHVRSGSTSTNAVHGSGASVTFSALPPSPQSSRPPSMLNPAGMILPNAPLHTTHHPRNNPRPSSPPLDNASVLTLASSAFAFSGTRFISQGWSSTSPSAFGGGDSLSHFGGSLNGGVYADGESTSHFVLGDDERLDESNVDASVRALRPRSSRRGSWDSETSDWSARVQGASTSSFLRERSVRTTNSVGTGGQLSAEDVDKQVGTSIAHEGSSSPEAQTIAGSAEADGGDDAIHLPTPPIIVNAEIEPTKAVKADDPDAHLPVATLEHGSRSTDTVALRDGSPILDEARADMQGVVSLGTDAWHSAPSTPMVE